MQLFKREWISYRKPTILWSIGLVLLVIIAFYKVDGMSGMPGGMNALIETLPPAFQAIFGMGYDYTTGIGLYSFIHLYILIALAFPAALLGASLFAKEEHDKTFEFLYVKGMKRTTILGIKILAGISILLCLNIICYIATFASLSIIGKGATFSEMYPFILGILLTQVFFFSITFLLTFVLPNNQKAGIIACYIILAMFLITMYTKLGGNVEVLNNLSVFYYMDASQLNKGIHTLSFICLSLLSVGCLGLSVFRHEHRDLL